jgi:hypothetical protein
MKRFAGVLAEPARLSRAPNGERFRSLCAVGVPKARLLPEHMFAPGWGLNGRTAGQGQQVTLAGVEGLEPPTLGLEIRCSIRLSYTPLQILAYCIQSVLIKHFMRSFASGDLGASA